MDSLHSCNIHLNQDIEHFQTKNVPPFEFILDPYHRVTIALITDGKQSVVSFSLTSSGGVNNCSLPN